MQNIIKELVVIVGLDSQDGPSHSLFSIETFRDYIRPKLIEIFKVHDLQIRLLLLHYLPKFIPVFTKEELQKSILPELLVGIKDTNDELVIATLKALADLVPLLGSELVVGGKRAKLFNDGRPNNSIKIASSKLIPQVKILSSNPVQITVANPVVIETTNLNILAERPRPDGEEGSESQEILQSGEEDLEKWDDWTTSENIEEIRILEENVDILNNEILESSVSTNMNSSSTKQTGNKVIPDITELDIKNQARSKDDDIDFFEDMEPVISNSNKFLIDEQNDIKLEKEINCKLALYASENGEEGWGDNWD